MALRSDLDCSDVSSADRFLRSQRLRLRVGSSLQPVQGALLTILAIMSEVMTVATSALASSRRRSMQKALQRLISERTESEH